MHNGFSGPTCEFGGFGCAGEFVGEFLGYGEAGSVGGGEDLVIIY